MVRSCPSSMTSPALMSFAALSTDCGFMWLPEPRSSPAPHLEGQRALSGGGDHDGVWATAAPEANSAARAMMDGLMGGFLPWRMLTGKYHTGWEPEGTKRLPRCYG